MVTAEIAVALPALVLAGLLALTGVEVLGAQLRCLDAAGVAARLAARGEGAPTVTAAAAAAGPPHLRLRLRLEDGLVVADVTVTVHPLGISRLLPGFAVDEHAVSAAEAGVNSWAP